MKVSQRRITSITLLAIIVAASIVGCAQIRKLTYPKDFTYLEKREVDTLMQQMSDSIVRLDRLVGDAAPSDPGQQQKIVGELNVLESIANRLSGGGKQTNFPVLSEHIEEFIGDIVDAKMFAGTTPPNYSSAGKLTDSCLACHQFR